MIRLLRFAWLPLLLALLAAPGPAAAAPRDPDPAPPPPASVSAYQARQAWFSRDKAYHFTLSAAGAAVVYAVGREAGLGRVGSALAAAVVTGTAGLLRESLIHDGDVGLFSRAYFSRRDMVWNTVGIAFGISVTDLVAFGRSPPR